MAALFCKMLSTNHSAICPLPMGQIASAYVSRLAMNCFPVIVMPPILLRAAIGKLTALHRDLLHIFQFKNQPLKAYVDDAPITRQ